MSRFALRACLAVAVCGGLAASSPVRANDRTADAILKDIDAVKVPEYDPSKRGDRDYIRAVSDQRFRAMKYKAELIGELHHAYPDNPLLAKLMPERWKVMIAKDAVGELDEVLARTNDEALRKEAAYWKARFALQTARRGPGAAIQAIDEFQKIAPMDDRGASLLMSLGHRLGDLPDRQKAVHQRVIDEYPESPSADMARGILLRSEVIGKPFELSFTDAITGSEVSNKSLKGKVVVIDFWATWCGPCVAEMPKMKKLYEEYRGQGVEFVGVSLDLPKDEGGLDKLKAFVEKNEIPWPQYYQGNAWESKFSSSWGINAIPCVFLVDQEGRLYSTAARGKLETMIPELLKKKATPKPDEGND